MPLLLCPNDNAVMQTIDRDGVQFDMCPTCRGVWLDRGELEKLMQASAQGAAAAPPPAAPYPGPAPQDYGRREDHRYRDDDRKRGYYKKPKSIFDIFD